LAAAQPGGHRLAILQDEDHEHEGDHKADEVGETLQDVARYTQHVGLENEMAVENEIAEALDPDVKIGCGLVVHRQKTQRRRPRHQDRARHEQHALNPDRRQDQRQSHRLCGRAKTEEQQQTEADGGKRCGWQHIEDGSRRKRTQPDEHAGGGGRRADPVPRSDGKPAHDIVGQPAEQQHGGDLADHLVPVDTRVLLGLRDQPLPHVRHIDHRQCDARDRIGELAQASAEFRSEGVSERFDFRGRGRRGCLTARDQRPELREELLPCGGIIERGHQPLQLLGIDRRRWCRLVNKRRLLRSRTATRSRGEAKQHEGHRDASPGAQAGRAGSAVGPLGPSPPRRYGRALRTVRRRPAHRASPESHIDRLRHRVAGSL
jgi:hypothetical protein